jgi:hypothetical protein
MLGFLDMNNCLKKFEIKNMFYCSVFIKIVEILFKSWVNPLISLGHKKPLVDEDLFSPLNSDEAKRLTEQLEV